MRIYNKEQACGFRYTKAAWGTFSKFQPLALPIVAGPWSFGTSEALYQAAKFAARPEIQQRIADAPTAREAAAIGRSPGSAAPWAKPRRSSSRPCSRSGASCPIPGPSSTIPRTRVR